MDNQTGHTGEGLLWLGEGEISLEGVTDLPDGFTSRKIGS
jgi:hypothetical protein